MGSVFHQLCPRYSGTLTPTAPTAIRLWDTFTFTLTNDVVCFEQLGPEQYFCIVIMPLAENWFAARLLSFNTLSILKGFDLHYDCHSSFGSTLDIWVQLK